MTKARLAATGMLMAAGLLAQAPSPAFVEVEPSTTTAWVHEPVEIVVRVGFDAAFFVASGLPLFQQRLDQPFQVVVPWIAAAEDRAVEILPLAAGVAGSRIAVGDRVVGCARAGQRRVGDRVFDLLELRCRWVPLAPGTSAIAPVELRYAFATRFQDDFLRGRQPLDRQEASVLSPPAQLVVKALPREGRPAGFAGAVGEFEVRAATSATEVAVGQSFLLAVTVAGAGNLDRCAPMPWPELPGFHVQGLVERRGDGTRTFVFDVLALREGLALVPAAQFVAFSPRRAAYVTHAAGPVPLRIVAAPPGTELPERVRALVVADARAARSSALGLPGWGLALGALLVGLGALVLAARRRRTVRGAAVRAAQHRLHEAVGGDPAALLPAFEAVCAGRAGLGAFAAPAVWDALAQGGCAADVVARARGLHTALEAARYGGVPPAPAEVRAVARDLLA